MITQIGAGSLEQSAKAHLAEVAAGDTAPVRIDSRSEKNIRRKRGAKGHFSAFYPVRGIDGRRAHALALSRSVDLGKSQAEGTLALKVVPIIGSGRTPSRGKYRGNDEEKK